ncbi:sialidase-1 [Geomicrobium halophilum]|uniref:exo-alpha-sialidase n=1 Tax=Geomicrobium halophilum TaxID=549000 RepID=A0A841Q090_9BACL|nr:sialidase family protein [Geomicrobium halophilum]MBB6450973.1 sialidase-1 [Geomicrobium halophilum]
MKETVIRSLITLIPVVFIFAFADESGAAAETPDPILQIENQTITDNNYIKLNEEVEQLNTLDEGTIVVRFRHEGSSIMSLFSLSNNNVSDGHFHFYISPNTIGSENRYEAPGEPQENIHIASEPVELKEGEVHTAAMVMDKDEGYKYFLNGELVKEDTQSPRKFLSNIYNPNRSYLGQTDRESGNNYPFSGDIDFADIYSEPLSDETLKNITEETASEPVTNPMPEDAYVSDSESIFYPGFMDSPNFRIPALYYTQNDTLLAGIDRRVGGPGDSPNDIHAALRRSMDQGDTWEEEGSLINAYPDEASNIDLAFTEDISNERVFALVDGFPDGAGLMGGFGANINKGTGFTTIDGEDYMFLTDEDDRQYTIREEGKVYDEEGNLTDYSVDMQRNLYESGEKIDNIFSESSPLKPFKTSYLELYYSDDDGETWTGPIDLNDQVKEEYMMFLGVGPGNGIQLSEGPNEGRLVFPVYFINDNNRQASAVIYSDDNGETWHRGESPNEGRVIGDGETINEKDFTEQDHEITEAQVVEMPDGQLKLFMRNYSGYAQIATSLDGGETWQEEVKTEEDLVAPYSQMSAIRYDGQIDGKEAVIFSSANHSVDRINGTVRVGLIEENGTDENGYTDYSFDWKYEQLVKQGHYGYSSLTNLPDGEIGLFYEGTPNTEMDFMKFNTEFLKWEQEGEKPIPELASMDVILSPPPVYRSGEKIQIEATFEDYVMLNGNKRLSATIGEEETYFELVEQKGHDQFVFETEVPELSPGTHNLQAKFDPDLNIYNVYGEKLMNEKEENKMTDTIRVRASGQGR